MSSPKSIRIRCATCALCLDAVQRECCINSCIPFLDKVVVDGGQKSSASIPDLLEFRLKNNERTVVSRVGIPVRAIFGPLVAPNKEVSSPSAVKYAVGTYGFWRGFVLESDDHCNWMKHVRQAENAAEQNLTAFQFKGSVYFAALREIKFGEELKVWYANNYAVEMEKMSVPGFRPGDLALDAEENNAEASSSGGTSSSTTLPSGTFESDIFGMQNYPLPIASDQMHYSLFPTAHFDNLGTGSAEQANLNALWESLSSGFTSMDTTNLHVPPEVPVEPVAHACGSSCSHDNPSGDADMVFQPASSTTPEPAALLYRCGVCNDKFPTDLELRKHLKDVHSEEDSESEASSQKKCIFCLESYPRSEMTEHVSSHCVDGEYSCRACQKTFSTPAKVRSHLDNIHKARKLACGVCDFTAAKAYQLRKHVDGHVNPDNNSWSCSMCDKIFKAKENINAHMRNVHKLRAGSVTSEMEEKELEKREEQEQDLLKCVLCLLSFRNQKALGEHFSTHRSLAQFTCQLCHKIFENLDKARKHNYVHRPNQFSCDICGHATRNERMLRLHMVTHSKAELECLYCILKFKEEQSLRKHTMLMHNPNRPKKPSKKISKRKQEQESTLTESHFYKCRECNLGFYHRKSLLAHLETRHPELPLHKVPELNLPVKKVNAYQCRECKTRFLTEEHAKNHIEKKHWLPPAADGSDPPTIDQRMETMMKQHLFNAHWCELCGIFFLGGKVLLKHVKLAHPEYLSILMPETVGPTGSSGS